MRIQYLNVIPVEMGKFPLKRSGSVQMYVNGMLVAERLLFGIERVHELCILYNVNV